MQEKKSWHTDRWMYLMVLIPSVIPLCIINASANLSIVLPAAVCSLAAGCGTIILNWTGPKPSMFKLLCSFLLILTTTLLSFWIVYEKDDATLLEQDWQSQQIGKTSFRVPQRLKKESIAVPNNLQFFYKKLVVYSQEENKRSTLFIQFTLKKEIYSLEDFFPKALNGMLQKMGIPLETLTLEKWHDEEALIASKMSYKVNDVLVSGYVYMIMRSKTIESLWLFPYRKGFSDAYIEYFDDNINALRT